jgi:hypothetical protein
MPNPDATQGEAEGTARLAKESGVRLVLVTTPDQTWEAEPRFWRCYSGKVYAGTTPLPKDLWPLMVAYQWAATLKGAGDGRFCWGGCVCPSEGTPTSPTVSLRHSALKAN